MYRCMWRHVDEWSQLLIINFTWILYLRFKEVLYRLSWTQGGGNLHEECTVISFTTAVELKKKPRDKRSVTQQKNHDWHHLSLRHKTTTVLTIPHYIQLTYRIVEHIQDLDGSVFTRRPRDIQCLDVCRVVEVDQLFRNLWTMESCTHLKTIRWTRFTGEDTENKSEDEGLQQGVCSHHLPCPCSWNPRLLQQLHRQTGSPKRKRT